MQAVKEWLAGPRNFEAGVELYAANGGSNFNLTMFRNAGPTDFNKNKLATEMAKIAAKQPTKAPSPALTSQPTVKAPSPNPTPDKGADNRRYLDLLRKKKDLYTQLNMLMTEKRHLPEGEELRKCAFAIIAAHQSLTECWALIDYYQEHNRFPATPAPVQRDDATRIQYLRQSISKARKRLNGTKCRDRAATEQLLKAKEQELAQLTCNPAD